jgi:FSR family fosmidomycin resistance protein-like MFS transporter
MTQLTSQATDVLSSSRASETKLVASVCFAHLVSHYFIVLLAPLFAFIRADYGVSYTELGLALTAFGAVSAVLQTPVGFLIDRSDPRTILIGGLLLGSGAIAVAALVDSYWVFVAMFAVMGAANTVYHPSDYTLLSEGVSPQRMTQVFSYHNCSGMIGSAVAPVTLLFMQSFVGWRGAFLGATVLGIVAALILALQDMPVARRHKRKPQPDATGKPSATTAPAAGIKLLLSPPILLNLLLFFMLSMVGGGFNQFLVVSLGALHGTPPAVANTALTGLLTMSAIGVLIGGALAGRTSRHNLVTALGLGVTGLVALFIGYVDPGTLLLVLVVSLGGFASGIGVPSRDMIVRSATPPGSFGKVFGFVTTGLHIGGMISPVIFGQFLDHGEPRAVFLYIAACALVAVATVGFGMSSRRPV